MPQLKDTREEIKLPINSIEGSEVTIRNGLLAGDMEYVYGNNSTSDVERTLRALSRMIVAWNLTDEQDKELPITLDNIKKLDTIDVTKLIEATSFGQGMKKKQTLKD